jgi:hypothetical protein
MTFISAEAFELPSIAETHNVLRVKGSLVPTAFVDLDRPVTLVILFRLGDGRLGPNRELHGRCVPLHEQAEFLGRGIGRPMFRVGEVWEVIGPVREMEREVFVSVAPDGSDLLRAFDDERRDP